MAIALAVPFIRPIAFAIKPPAPERIARSIAADLYVRFGESNRLQMVFEGSRGSAKNTMIAKVQANPKNHKWKRDPFFFNANAMKLIRAAYPDLYAKAASIRASAMARIKQAMIVTVLDNAKSERNPDGSRFTSLKSGYARRKAQQVGFVHPILRATGDLLDGIRVRLTKTGGRK